MVIATLFLPIVRTTLLLLPVYYATAITASGHLIRINLYFYILLTTFYLAVFAPALWTRASTFGGASERGAARRRAEGRGG